MEGHEKRRPAKDHFLRSLACLFLLFILKKSGFFSHTKETAEISQGMAILESCDTAEESLRALCRGPANCGRWTPTKRISLPKYFKPYAVLGSLIANSVKQLCCVFQV